MPRRRPPDHRPLSISGSHWRADGEAKVRFAAKADAQLAAAERSRVSGADLHVYRCDFCGGWHMGRGGGRDPG
jgi:hypothetical protein